MKYERHGVSKNIEFDCVGLRTNSYKEAQACYVELDKLKQAAGSKMAEEISMDLVLRNSRSKPERVADKITEIVVETFVGQAPNDPTYALSNPTFAQEAEEIKRIRMNLQKRGDAR